MVARAPAAPVAPAHDRVVNRGTRAQGRRTTASAASAKGSLALALALAEEMTSTRPRATRMRLLAGLPSLMTVSPGMKLRSDKTRVL